MCSKEQPPETVVRLLQNYSFRKSEFLEKIIFRKSATSVTLEVHYLKGIFHRFWLQFPYIFNPQHFFFRTLLSGWFLFILFSIKAFTANFFVCLLIYVFFEGKITGYVGHLIARHTLQCKTMEGVFTLSWVIENKY